MNRLLIWGLNILVTLMMVNGWLATRFVEHGTVGDAWNNVFASGMLGIVGGSLLIFWIRRDYGESSVQS